VNEGIEEGEAGDQSLHSTIIVQFQGSLSVGGEPRNFAVLLGGLLLVLLNN